MDRPHLYPQLTFDLVLKRKPAYYMLNIFAPSVLLVVLSLVMFLLPVEAGDKVTLGITVLVGFSVFQVLLENITPRNSDYMSVFSKYGNV